MNQRRMYDRVTPFPLPPSYEGKFEEYRERLQKAMGELMDFASNRPPNQATQLMQDAMNQAMHELVARDRMLMVAPKLHLAKAAVEFIQYEPPEDRLERLRLEREGLDQDRLLTTLVLEFYPGPCWPVNYSGTNGGVPLGCFYEGWDRPEAYRRVYDLYYMPQGNLPPTLVARYGSDGADYNSLNPSLAEIDPENELHAPYAEAYKRAVRFGLMQEQPLQGKIKVLGSGN